MVIHPSNTDLLSTTTLCASNVKYHNTVPMAVTQATDQKPDMLDSKTQPFPPSLYADCI